MMQPLEPVREEDEGPLASTSTSTSTAAQHRAAAHPRQHSRIHERNLSAFFPRPGHATHGYGGTFDDPHAPTPFAPGVADIPSAPSPARATTHAPVGPAAGEASVSPPKTRRGHHHRHSVSHNLFPFLDSPSNPNGAAPGSRGALHSPTQSRTPTKAHEDQLPAPTASFRQRHGHLPLPLRLALFASLHIPLTARLLLALAFAQVVVGATLWVQGQAGESLAVTGLGYLVVFDGVGALSSVLLERDGALERTLQALGSQKDMSIRRPYGCVLASLPLPSYRIQAHPSPESPAPPASSRCRTSRKPSTSSSRPCTSARSRSSTSCSCTARRTRMARTGRATAGSGMERGLLSLRTGMATGAPPAF